MKSVGFSGTLLLIVFFFHLLAYLNLVVVVILSFFYYNGINVCILFLRCFPVMIWCVFPLSFSYTFFYCLICCS